MTGWTALRTAALVSVALLIWASCRPAAAQGRDNELERLNRELGRQQVLEHARKIDELLEADYAEHETRANLPLEDGVFLRRIYLDAIGRIPYHHEALEFLRNNSSQKRVDLIDRLVTSPGYASHFFNYWADLLRIESNLQNYVDGEAYAQWVKRAIAENTPYDRFVYELLTASGRIEENGAAGYYIRDSGMPLDHAANTTRLFLGTSLGCAMCHDHPFDKWSQMEFYETAAFTYGVETRSRGNPNLDRAFRMARKQAFESEDRQDRRLVNYLRRLSRADNFRVHDVERRLRLPDDYKYADGEPGQVVEPFTIFGEIAERLEGESWREVYTRWMTSPENPRFAKTIANRLWKRAFGLGLIEPVGQLTDGSKTAHPELLEHLTGLMVDLGFDLRQFQRILYYTRAYQRQAGREEPTPGEPYVFTGPALRRMTAEQIWDSLLVLAVPGVDERLDQAGAEPEPPSSAYRYELYEDKSPEQIIRIARQQLRSARGDREMMMTMMGRGGGGDAKVRASELPQPAPPGHPLRRFGQSDRQLIDNASAEPSVTQVLFLMNGPIDDVLLKQRTVLSENVRNAPTAPEKLAAIWLSVMSRYPTPAEQAIAMQEVRYGGDTAYANLVWALLNTREFLFIQ